MKLITFFLTVCILQISAVTTYSQNQKINFSVTNYPLEKIFQEIEKQTKFRFLYRLENVENRSANLTCNNLTVEQILNKLFINLDIAYRILDNNLIVIAPVESLQTIKVSGTVTDASNNEPLVGVNIVVEGTTTGTITDVNGKYTIDVSNKEAVLIFSFVGYLNERIAVAGKTGIDIMLTPDVQKLDEVVVIGYGTTKKSDLTGSVMSANLKDFEKSPNTNLVQSLQGTIPGLNVGQVTQAGATPTFTLRGTNTISGNTSLLIVMDGIIYNNSLSSINPSDIESVDILKDASSTSVYGAQAANGVMLITTKKGKAGKARISLSSSYSIQNPSKNYSTMNRDQYLGFLKNLMWDQAYTVESGYMESNPSFVLANSLPDSYMRNPDGTITSTDTRWWDLCTRQGSILENQATITGGNEAVSYLVSFGNTNQKNYLVNDNFKRNSVRVNLDANVRSWWKLGTQLSGSFVNQDGSEPTLWTLYSMNPLAFPYKSDGSINPTPMETARDNPLMGSNIDDLERHYYFIGNLYSEFRLLKGLTYRINYGNNYTINKHFLASPYANSQSGEAYKEYSTSYNYTVDNIVNYTKDFSLHSVTATLVYGLRKSEYSQTKADALKFTNLLLGYNSLELGTTQLTTSDANDNSSLYQMARLNYKFNNRYLLTATLRRDGYSGFAANFKSALFPSVALGWVISDESFFENIPVINYLKLRGGYGVSGNLPYNPDKYINSYLSLATVVSNAGYVFGDGGTAVIRQELSTLENKNLKWEKTKGYNLGLDFRLLNDRINGSVEAYKTTTTDLLYRVSIPTITGFSSIYSNIGELQNRGIEFSFTSHNLVTKNFNWSTTFNISSNTNKIVELAGSGDLISSCLFIGKSTGTIYDYKIDGIYQVGEQSIPSGYNVGNYKIHDSSGDGLITTADRTIVGKREPAYRFSIMNKFSYKSYSLSFFFNSVQGGKDGYLGENTYTLIQDNTSRLCNHVDEFRKNVWSPLNPDGVYSASTRSGALVPIRYEDRSFIRLQDVTLGYDLPKKLISPMRLENVNIFITGKNLLIITKWHGWDPEADYGSITPAWKTSTINKSGDDYEGRPVMKSFTFGINVTF